MRSGGLGMGGSRAERSPRQGLARGGQTDPSQRKPDLKKLWPQIWRLVSPRMVVIAVGLCLMVVNRVAGLVLPYKSKALMDKVLNIQHPHPEMLLQIIALVFGAIVGQAITSFSLTQLLPKA